MGGFSVIVVLAPMFIVGGVFSIAVLIFLSTCFLVMGICGVAMNKIYLNQTLSGKRIVPAFFNICSIIAGIGFIAIPAVLFIVTLINQPL